MAEFSLPKNSKIVDGKTHPEPKSSGEKKVFKIERVAVLPEFRRLKVGSLLINKIVEFYLNSKKNNSIILHSQVSVEGFYKSLNFISYGDQFYEDGIPHIAMEYKN